MYLARKAYIAKESDKILKADLKDRVKVKKNRTLDLYVGYSQSENSSDIFNILSLCKATSCNFSYRYFVTSSGILSLIRLSSKEKHSYSYSYSYSNNLQFLPWLVFFLFNLTLSQCLCPTILAVF